MLTLYFNRAIQDIRSNRFLNVVTISTIALSILIVSAFALFYINTNDLIESWKQGVRVMVYLKSGTLKADIPALQEKMQKISGVEKTRFISKEEGLERMKKQMQHHAALLENLRENPLPDMFEIQLTTASSSWTNVEKISASLQALPPVAEVEYGQRWLGKFTQVINLFNLAGYGLGALFFMAAVFFVANTIRLVLYSRREEVEIMRLVGAEDRFIKAPFYIEGLIQGALGGMIGIAALFVVYQALNANIQKDLIAGAFRLRFLPPAVLGGVVVSSMIVGWLGCYLSLKQFLKT
jgi:cell division transport system permease protein